MAITRMTPRALKKYQNELEMSDRDMADFLCVDARNFRRMKTGGTDVPLWISKFLPVFVEIHAINADQIDEAGFREIQKGMGLP